MNQNLYLDYQATKTKLHAEKQRLLHKVTEATQALADARQAVLDQDAKIAQAWHDYVAACQTAKAAAPNPRQTKRDQLHAELERLIVQYVAATAERERLRHSTDYTEASTGFIANETRLQNLWKSAKKAAKRLHIDVPALNRMIEQPQEKQNADE